MGEEDKKLQVAVDRHLDTVFMWEDDIISEINDFYQYAENSDMAFRYKETIKNRIRLLRKSFSEYVTVCMKETWDEMNRVEKEIDSEK